MTTCNEIILNEKTSPTEIASMIGKTVSFTKINELTSQDDHVIYGKLKSVSFRMVTDHVNGSYKGYNLRISGEYYLLPRDSKITVYTSKV